MTASIEKKYKLIQLIMAEDDEQVLTRIEDSLTSQKSQVQASSPSFFNAVKPARKGLSFQQILEEQKYKPITYEQFREKAAGVDIQEPLDELLELLTK